MTKEEARQAAEILTAYAEGKEIQKRFTPNEDWETFDIDNHNFVFGDEDCRWEYRIVKKPGERCEVPQDECSSPSKERASIALHTVLQAVSKYRYMNELEIKSHIDKFGTDDEREIVKKLEVTELEREAFCEVCPTHEMYVANASEVYQNLKEMLELTTDEELTSLIEASLELT